MGSIYRDGKRWRAQYKEGDQTKRKRFNSEQEARAFVEQIEGGMSEEPSGRGIVSNLFRPASSKSKEPRKKKEPPARKKSMAKNIGTIYGVAGGYISMRAKEIPGRPGQYFHPLYRTGRLMQFQSPLAGKELDAWVRSHDVIYTLVEPLLGMEGFNVLTSVVAPPLIMALLETRPEMLPVLQPLLMPVLMDIFKQVKKARAEFKEAVAELDDEGFDEAEYNEFLSSLGFLTQQESPFGSGPEAHTATNEPPSRETEHESGPDTFPPAEPVPAVDLGPPMEQPDGDGQGEWVNGVWFPQQGSRPVESAPGPFPT